LDIGTGFDYFSYVCEYFGSKATAIDVLGHWLFNDAMDFWA
jgi:hypothetical protein